jgi:hypothetical protein
MEKLYSVTVIGEKNHILFTARKGMISWDSFIDANTL